MQYKYVAFGRNTIIASNYNPGVYSFSAIFNQVTKRDRCLLVEDSLCAVYNLWCQQRVLMEADDAWSTILYILLCYSVLYLSH